MKSRLGAIYVSPSLLTAGQGVSSHPVGLLWADGVEKSVGCLLDTGEWEILSSGACFCFREGCVHVSIFVCVLVCVCYLCVGACACVWGWGGHDTPGGNFRGPVNDSGHRWHPVGALLVSSEFPLPPVPLHLHSATDYLHS